MAQKKGATAPLAGLMIFAMLSSRSTKTRLTKWRKRQEQFVERTTQTSATLCALLRE
jgi:hypothetical protein